MPNTPRTAKRVAKASAAVWSCPDCSPEMSAALPRSTLLAPALYVRRTNGLKHMNDYEKGKLREWLTRPGIRAIVSRLFPLTPSLVTELDSKDLKRISWTFAIGWSDAEYHGVFEVLKDEGLIAYDGTHISTIQQALETLPPSPQPPT